MRAIILAAALALAPFATGAAAHPVAQHQNRPRHACSWRYDWSTGTNYPADKAYAQADWEVNTCGYVMVVRITCQVLGNPNDIYQHDSGSVSGLEINDKATCFAGDIGILAQIHYNGAWHTLCSGSGCFAPVRRASHG